MNLQERREWAKEISSLSFSHTLTDVISDLCIDYGSSDPKSVVFCDKKTAEHPNTEFGLVIYDVAQHRAARARREVAGFLFMYEHGERETYRRVILSSLENRLRRSKKVYVHIVTDPTKVSEYYYKSMIVHKGKKEIDQLEQLLERSLIEGSIGVIRDQIDEAIDSGDRERFEELSKKLSEKQEELQEITM